jgi:hypothetical protein
MEEKYREIYPDKNLTLTPYSFFVKDGFIWATDSKEQDRDFFPGIGIFGIFEDDAPYVLLDQSCFEKSLAKYFVTIMRSSFLHNFEIYKDAEIAATMVVKKIIKHIACIHKRGIIVCDDDCWSWASRNVNKIENAFFWQEEEDLNS